MFAGVDFLARIKKGYKPEPGEVVAVSFDSDVDGERDMGLVTMSIRVTTDTKPTECGVLMDVCEAKELHKALGMVIQQAIHARQHHHKVEDEDDTVEMPAPSEPLPDTERNGVVH